MKSERADHERCVGWTTVVNAYLLKSDDHGVVRGFVNGASGRPDPQIDPPPCPFGGARHARSCPKMPDVKSAERMSGTRTNR
jgi:hypothetical protein